MNSVDSNLALNAIAHEAQVASEAWRDVARAHGSPWVLCRVKLSIDGNQWCALYGENLQDGVAGFGDSPELACWDFDRAWYEKLPKKAAP